MRKEIIQDSGLLEIRGEILTVLAEARNGRLVSFFKNIVDSTPPLLWV